MGRRIRWLGVILILCFALVLVQLANVQFRKASALANSKNNPKNFVANLDKTRGDIMAADGTVLAYSEKATSGSYKYQRVYPLGPLTSQVVGFDSLIYGTTGVESVYNQYLVAHHQAAKTIGQLLSPPPETTDNVTLTIVPSLQRVAQQELADLPGPNRDGAVVAINPTTGAIEAMYSSPTYDPNPLASPTSAGENLGDVAYLGKDAEGFSPSSPIALREVFPPGSTMKVVTSTAVYNLKPQLSNFVWPNPLQPATGPASACIALPHSNKLLCNDGGSPCGGNMTLMLPQSCDPGYGALGMALGGKTLWQQAAAFGYDQVPPIDIPGAVASNFPTPAELGPAQLGQPGQAYSAIGQQDVEATALQNCLVAAGIANGGVVMTPHVMAEVRSSDGTLVASYQPTPWKTAATQQAAGQVTPLMQAVVTSGTASGVGFPSILNAAVKTGTAQRQAPGQVEETDDWMIGFAPANDPKIAIAVVVPYQPYSAYGATIAGPIVKAMMEAALSLPTNSAPAPPASQP